MFRRFKGFTIMELMLVMSLMVMIMTMVHSALAVSGKICSFGRERAGLYHGARLAMEEILGALSNMEYASTGKYEFVSFAGSLDGLPSDSVSFVTLVKPQEMNGAWMAGEARVRYFVSRREDGTGVLQKEVCPATDEILPADEASVIDMCEGVGGLKIEYFDEDGNSVEEWVASTEEDQDNPPYEAVVTLYLESGDMVKPVMSAVMLPTMKSRSGEVDSGSNSSSDEHGEPEEADFDDGGGPSSGGGGGRGGSGGGPGGGPGGGGGAPSGGGPSPK